MTPLEALNDLREINGWNDKEFNKRLDIIEKSLKALEIIKKCTAKERYIVLDEDNYNFDKETTITKEELKLVREVLL